MSQVFVNYAHFLGLGGLFAALAAEMVLFRPQLAGATARRLARIDAVYGLSALTILGSGLLKVFAGDKPAAYYGHNPLFHVKVTLFVVALAMAVYPAIQFLRNRKAAADSQVTMPGSVGLLLRLQMVVLVLIPLLAVLMARGYGYGA